MDIDITKEREKALKKTKDKHEWRQKGNRIYCKSCTPQHGFFVSPDQMLIDVKNDIPVLGRS